MIKIAGQKLDFFNDDLIKDFCDYDPNMQSYNKRVNCFFYQIRLFNNLSDTSEQYELTKQKYKQIIAVQNTSENQNKIYNN